MSTDARLLCPHCRAIATSAMLRSLDDGIVKCVACGQVNVTGNYLVAMTVTQFGQWALQFALPQYRPQPTAALEPAP